MFFHNKVPSISILKTDLGVSSVFGRLKANIDFSMLGIKSPCLMVTSSLPREGKTTIAAYTAAFMGASGKKTLLVDADINNASVHELFGCANRHGFSDVISQKADWRDVLVDSGMANLTLITAGNKPAHESRYLNSEWMREFLDDIRREFEYIVLDTPPILVIPDSQVISSLASGVILVVNNDKTSKDAVRKSASLLKLANANLIDTVLNNVERRAGGYGYGYGYYSGRRPSPVTVTRMFRHEEVPSGKPEASEAAEAPSGLSGITGCYCLLCRTGSEKGLAYSIGKRFRELTAIVPSKIQQEKHQNHWEKKEQVILPGYVFLFTSDGFPSDLLSVVNDLNKTIETGTTLKKLEACDEEFARWIARHSGLIVPSRVIVRGGGDFEILEGPLLDFPGRISKMDRQKRRAAVEFEFDGQEMTMQFGIECQTAEGEGAGAHPENTEHEGVTGRTGRAERRV